MNLKESYRYHNYLESLMVGAARYLSTPGNVMNVKSEHMRKKVNPDAEDETLDASAERTIQCEDNNQMIDFLVAVCNERCALALAVERAKQDFKAVCYDAELFSNRCRQTVASTLKRLADIKSTERITTGTAYKFNAEGNQIQYRYDVKEIATIDFDRKKAKEIARKFSQEANEVSDRLDHAMLEATVVFDPRFSLDDSFEEAFLNFINKED
ncbi:MAG: hypothetical protein IJV14_10895 [Lachnospiraceae bacterium]|nr:hypothetical protein [Lachnospiraceae bacterium]